MTKRIGLKPGEIAGAFDNNEQGREFRAILDVPQVARLLGVSVKTIYFWVSMGRFDGSFRKRGKHLRFWRDRVIDLFFNGTEWESKQNES